MPPRFTKQTASILLLLLTACASVGPINPSFPVSTTTADKILDNAAAHPKPLKRPLVIVGGFLDPGVGPLYLQSRLSHCINDQRIISVPLGFCFSLDQCRQKVIAAVDQSFPTTDPNETTEVDVIGISLGGLAARYAADPPQAPQKRQLRIARLFTYSTPHRGAQVASMPVTVHPLQSNLRSDASFIQQLNTNPLYFQNIYPIYAYVRLGDTAIGLENSAPPGQTAWWVDTPPLRRAHTGAFLDPRILADILLRLRDQPPLATDPPAPYPKSTGTW